MCESSVLMEKGGKQELLMEDVAQVVVDGEDIELRGILGERRHVRGKIKEVDMLKHTILIR